MPSIRFIADAMLGRLVRWLRILGYDTAYEKMIADELLLERVIRENRWLLTRDRRLAERRLLRGRHTLLVSDHVEGQLQQLHRDLMLDLALSHDREYRCADCNIMLTPLSHVEAAPLVPPFVAQEYREFLHCPHCRRVFWPGTHWQNILGRIGAIATGRQDHPE